jgi:hypothetical protein
MKSYTFIIVLILLVTACKETTETTTIANETTEVISKEASITTKPKSNTTYLCKINGKDWAYTKASGIISAHARTKKRTALITFKKKLDKGSEHLQLTYDADTFQLIAASLQLKFPKKDGSLFTCYYDLKPETRKRHPESDLLGAIDLSNASVASGNGDINNLNIKFEKENLQNVEDAVLNISGLKFTNVGYSDLDKL